MNVNFGIGYSRSNAPGAKFVEQGGVQPHSQGDLYPVIVYSQGDTPAVMLGAVHTLVPNGPEGKRVQKVAAEAKRIYDAEGIVAAQKYLQGAVK